MIKCAIYARFSSNNQREASIDDQLRVCKEYCTKSNLTIIAEYADHAISGLTDKRPEFQRMIKDAERHLFEVLVLYSLDRFARDKYDSAIYKARLKRAGVRICYVTTPVGEGPEAVLMEALLEGMAQYYSENLSRNVKRGLEGNALKCLRTTGSAPLGYKVDENLHYQIDPVTAPTVQLIFKLYAEGHSMAAIIRHLKHENIKTRENGDFTPWTISYILQNEAYKGTYHWADIRIENGIPAIIDTDLFTRVQQMRTHNRTAKAKGKAKDDYLLTGKAFCGHCGAWLIGDSCYSRNHTQHFYYSCSRHKRAAKQCPKKSERKTDLEALALKACLQALTDDNIQKISEAAATELAKAAARDDITPALKKQLSEVERKIKNIMTAIEDGIYTPTTKDRLTELESERATLTAQLAKASAPRPLLTAPMLAYWLTNLRDNQTTNPDYQRTLIDTLLHSITVFDEESTKKVVLTFNLKTSTTRTLSGSDIGKIVDMTTQYPNQYILITPKLFAIMIYSDMSTCQEFSPIKNKPRR